MSAGSEHSALVPPPSVQTEFESGASRLRMTTADWHKHSIAGLFVYIDMTPADWHKHSIAELCGGYVDMTAAEKHSVKTTEQEHMWVRLVTNKMSLENKMSFENKNKMSLWCTVYLHFHVNLSSN